MGMETEKGRYESDERRTQATLLENEGTIGGKLDVFRGIRDMEDQIIIHAREYTGYCANDHLRFGIAEAREAIKNLESVSSNTQVFIEAADSSKARGYFAAITPEGRLVTAPDVQVAARGQFPVDVDWDKFKKAVSKAAKKPKTAV